MDDGSACVACPCPCPCRPAGTAEYYLAPTACLEDPEVVEAIIKEKKEKIEQFSVYKPFL